MGATDDGGEGGLYNSPGALLVGRRSDAAYKVARGTCHPSLASHTDIADRHISLVSWSMVGGLEVGLALRLRRLALWLVLWPGPHPPPEIYRGVPKLALRPMGGCRRMALSVRAGFAITVPVAELWRCRFRNHSIRFFGAIVLPIVCCLDQVGRADPGSDPRSAMRQTEAVGP
jgi:hypothetical protein